MLIPHLRVHVCPGYINNCMSSTCCSILRLPSNTHRHNAQAFRMSATRSAKTKLMNTGFDMLYSTTAEDGCFSLRSILDTSRHPQPQPQFAARTSTSHIRPARTGKQAIRNGLSTGSTPQDGGLLMMAGRIACYRNFASKLSRTRLG